MKAIDNVCRGMRDCMDVCLEIAKLMKFSPKRETMLEKIKMKDETMAESHEDLEDETEHESNAPLRMIFFTNQIDHDAC